MFCSLSLSAQEIDSLKQILNSNLNDSNYINTVLKLSEQQLEYSNDNPLQNLENALKKAKSISDVKKSEIYVANILGVIGYYYDLHGDFSQAISNYYKALEIGEKHGDNIIISSNLSNLAYVFDLQGNYEKAIETYEKSLNIKYLIGNKRSIAITLNNLAYSYKQLQNYDEALLNFNKSLSIFEEIKDEENIASAINNIALVFEKKGNLSAAENYFLRSLEIEKKFNKPINIVISYINIATNLHKQKKYERAKFYFSIVDSIANKSNIPEVTIPAYNNQSKFYATIEDYKKAYENYVKMTFIKDSIFSERSALQIAEISEIYESEKKQKEIDLLNKEKVLSQLKIEKKNQYIITVLIVLVLILILLILAFIAFNQKRKSNKLLILKNTEIAEAYEELNQQNEEILAQRDEIEQQRNHLELQNKEISDSINVAERIQKAFFKTEDDEKSVLPKHFVIFEPKDVVSGDFYWSHLVDNNNEKIIYISVVDCTGHGVPGAFMSMLGLSFINEILLKDPLISPANLLRELRTKVVSELSQNEDGDVKEGMDMALVRINMSTLEMQFSGANNPIYYTENEELIELKGTKQPIGFSYNQKDFKNHIVQLKKGEMIYLFSDGFADQFGGPKNKKIGYSKLKEILKVNKNQNIDFQKENIYSFFKTWKGDEEQIDDICLIGMKV